MSNIIDSVEKASEILIKGGVGIFPTDTAYGIGCRIDRADSVEKIYEIRKRPLEKSLLALVSSKEMAEAYAYISEKADKIIQRYWPGGLTIILRCKKEMVPGIVRSNGDTIAFRMPNHLEILKLIDKVGVPIVAPSANMSGQVTPLSFEEVNKKLIDEVDFALKGVCTIKGVSTIINATADDVKVVRQGVVKFL